MVGVIYLIVFVFFSFFPAVVLNFLSCSTSILQTRNEANQFFIQIKVYFFSNLLFCASFKSLLLLLLFLFLLLLIINFFSTCFILLLFLIFIV